MRQHAIYDIIYIRKDILLCLYHNNLCSVLVLLSNPLGLGMEY